MPPFAASLQSITSRRLPGPMLFSSMLWKKASPSLASAGVARHVMSMRKVSCFMALESSRPNSLEGCLLLMTLLGLVNCISRLSPP